MITPLKHHLPIVKICEKLKKADSQVCDLKYGEYFNPYTAEFLKWNIPSSIFETIHYHFH